MNITTAKAQIEDAVEAYLQRDEAGMPILDAVRQRPIFLVGAPGIGKTAIMEQIAGELNIGLVSYSMTHHTRQSALGLPRIVHRTYGEAEFDASEYTMSEIISSVYDYEERTGMQRGILFLDEINCVSETLYPSMLQFLQFKTFGRHKVPDGWVVVCAGNPPEYNKSVHEFDIVTLDRLRELDVEPDYNAWHAYAQAKGLHAAVVTFLQAKQDCFYSVETKPSGGKSFITARGWEDLAVTISLYEKMGKSVGRDLIDQFVRDEDVADDFAVYYELFQKYRSDYQIPRILAGTAGVDIVQRAQKAEFDERMAVLGLVLDALAATCQKALDAEEVVVSLRDDLRQAKPALLAGGSAASILGDCADKHAEERKRAESAGAQKRGAVRRSLLVEEALHQMVSQCATQRTPAGAQAFETISSEYAKRVEGLQAQVADADAQMTNAFAFVEESFGTKREMLVFAAELTTRKATTRFVAHYGNDAYYKHNDALQVDDSRKRLSDKLAALSGDEDALSLDMGGTVGISATPKPAEDDRKAQMEAYYAGKQFEYGFASMSKMTLPNSQLKGKTVLDVCCRRGKGVYKLSARVGANGRAIGVDVTPSYIEDAKAGMARAASDNGLPKPNMEFHVAYPEDLMEAGIGTASMDFVYINNVSTLLYDIPAALREFYRVLKPGGTLIYETVFADAERDAAVVEAARQMGNSIQAALPRHIFEEQAAAAGFAKPEQVDSYPVEADRGFQSGRSVETVQSDEKVAFEAVALNLRKPE